MSRNPRSYGNRYINTKCFKPFAKCYHTLEKFLLFVVTITYIPT